MAKPKKSPPRQITQEELAAFFNATKDAPATPAPVRSQKISAEEEKKQKELSEIGCNGARLYTKTVTVLGWAERFRLVRVMTEHGPAGYDWPFRVSDPFVNLEILGDCGYLEKFANGEEYVIGGKRYGVKDDVVWAGGKRYLSANERIGFGSFRDFLANQDGYSVRKCII